MIRMKNHQFIHFTKNEYIVNQDPKCYDYETGGATMPNIQSNKKRVLTNKKSELNNKRKKSLLKNTIRKFNDAVVEDDKEKADLYYGQSIKLLDKSVSSNIHHKNYATRRKTRITKKYKTLNESA